MCIVQGSVFVSIRENECKMHSSAWYIVGTQEMVVKFL